MLVLHAYTESPGCLDVFAKETSRSRSKGSATELEVGERCGQGFYRRVTLVVHGVREHGGTWWGWLINAPSGCAPASVTANFARVGGDNGAAKTIIVGGI